MDINKEKFVGKEVILFPNDTFKKRAIIVDVNEIGWTFKITWAQNDWNGKPCEKVGSIHFYNHTCKVHFEFV